MGRLVFGYVAERILRLAHQLNLLQGFTACLKQVTAP